MLGAIGHIPIQRSVDFPCICGNRGCLVALSGGSAIAKSLTLLNCLVTAISRP
ncbi:ROK family protein [Arthrobacter sp. D1-29]